MADFDRITKSIALWVPTNMSPTSETMRITETMLDHFKIEAIDKTEFAGTFELFYDKYIRNFETIDNSFCSKNYLGVNPDYVTQNSDKETFATLLSLDTDDYSGDIVRVNALITFRWSDTSKAIKIQTLCSDQRVKGTGEGTKLLNFVKKTARHMGIHNIYLNPLKNAVPYYYRQHFKNVTTANKKVHDSSDSPIALNPKKKTSKSSKSSKSSHSHSKSRKKSSHSPHAVKADVVPSMMMNLRARSNWNKTKMKLKALSAITRKTHGKSTVQMIPPHVPPRQKKSRNAFIIEQIDEIVGKLSEDAKSMTSYNDILKMLGKREIVNLTRDEEINIEDYLTDKHKIY